MNKKRNWAIAIILSAAAGLFAIKNVSAPASQSLNSASVTPIIASATINVPSLTPTYEGCGYIWAYHDDPELSQKFNALIQALDANASANAQLFGEDCVYADGHATFGVMETDFYISIPVEDLTAEEALGTWMEKTLNVITSLSQEEVQRKKGFAAFNFKKSESEQLNVRIDVQDYINNASGLSGVDLFRKYYIPPPSDTLTASTPTP
ncbi:MAG: hypothetical protein U0Z26_05915 [Anaerolineales bacterium]